jgi:hypothetical protein
MKLSNRALSLFPAWVNNDTLPHGLKMLAAYAAKNPGLDFRDYGDVTAYRGDSRMITDQLAAVRLALRFACACDVQDEHLISVSRGERLTIERTSEGGLSLDYTTGQYWPTEYRGAVARLLESATRAAARAVKEVQA